MLKKGFICYAIRFSKLRVVLINAVVKFVRSWSTLVILTPRRCYDLEVQCTVKLRIGVMSAPGRRCARLERVGPRRHAL